MYVIWECARRGNVAPGMDGGSWLPGVCIDAIE